MPVCDFCEEEYPRHMGVKFILKNGKVYNFCSKKCKRSLLDFDRDARKVKWTKSYREISRE